MNEIEAYYGKFNEENRLLRPYGRVEYLTTMKYIHDFIGERKNLSILDIGAGTGRYTIPLLSEGHNVTVVELVNYNLGILKQKAKREGVSEHLSPHKGSALNLKKYRDQKFDLILMLGPMYHLFSEEEKVKALEEAKMLLAPDGVLFVCYIMNEFGVIQYAFKENHAEESVQNHKLDQDFHIRNEISDLFSFDRLEDIDRYREKAELSRVKIFAQDGASNYMRESFKTMSDATFQLFLRYHLSTCERKDLLGASCHVVDILKRT